MKRILAALFLVVLVFGSFIVFPCHLHWMGFCWLTCSLTAFAKNKRMWPWLLGFILILTIKRPGFTVEFFGLVAAFLTVAGVDWRAARKNQVPNSLRRFVVYALILALPTAAYGATRWFAANTTQALIADGRPIACLGDSLTDFGYPQELEKLIPVPVADFGVNGITTDDGIEMLPEILAADPQLVVLELGGHDYNAERKTRSATRENLTKLITTFHEHNIGVILVEIPRGFISDPYDGLERELAAKFDLQLIDDSLIRSFVFLSPIVPPGSWLEPSQRFSNDGLHPNQRGNEYFARVVSETLVKIYGKSILN